MCSRTLKMLQPRKEMETMISSILRSGRLVEDLMLDGLHKPVWRNPWTKVEWIHTDKNRCKMLQTTQYPPQIIRILLLLVNRQWTLMTSLHREIQERQQNRITHQSIKLRKESSHKSGKSRLVFNPASMVIIMLPFTRPQKLKHPLELQSSAKTQIRKQN